MGLPQAYDMSRDLSSTNRKWVTNVIRLNESLESISAEMQNRFLSPIIKKKRPVLEMRR